MKWVRAVDWGRFDCTTFGQSFRQFVTIVVVMCLDPHESDTEGAGEVCDEVNAFQDCSRSYVGGGEGF